jgi:hypothetical protein
MVRETRWRRMWHVVVKQPRQLLGAAGGGAVLSLLHCCWAGLQYAERHLLPMSSVDPHAG